MAKLNQILTHKYKPESLKALSEEVAEESGEEWVTTESISEYNEALNLNLSNVQKIVRYLFVEHPYIGFLCFLFLPVIVLLPLAIFAPFILFIGLFVGFFVGSFIFPNIVSSCRVCGAIKKCEPIFTHCLEFEEHTEVRHSNGAICKYLVRVETVFCIYECEKCKGRKIEVLILQKEERTSE